jgi:8-oxo-dGTP pyrophosphatase MutT (NUDIX family)
MTPAEQIALWADRLRGISAMGLRFASNVHDELAFERVQTLAMEMIAAATGEPWETIEPLRAPVFSCPTPFCAGDAAIIDEQGRMLLIKRSDNGRWAMPGGALEVGESPAEGVLREALEETGYHCEVVAPVGVFDSRFLVTQTRHQLYLFEFLCRPLPVEPEQPSHAMETLDQGWFGQDELPTELDPGHRTRIAEAFRVWRGDGRVFFDGLPSEPDRLTL